MNEHDELRDAAGAWVLGALDEDEAWRFSAHLEVCASCREEVERLRVASDALPLAVPYEPPPAELKARLMDIVEREARPVPVAEPDRAPRFAWPRGWQARPAFAAAAAALLLLVGGAVGFAVRGGGGESTRLTALSVDATKARGAAAELVRTGDAVELRVTNMPAPPAGRVYEVWLQRDGRAPQPDAVFTVDRMGRGSVGVLGDVKGAAKVLVTDEPRGGSDVPTRQPVVTGRLS
jgi:anti-sigma-K factor RskA